MISAPLQEAIRQAENALHLHPGGDLPLCYRRAIWRRFGPPMPIEMGYSLARIRRTELAVTATEFVMPVWMAYWPEDRTPRRILEEARGVVRTTIDAAEAFRLHDRWESEVEHKIFITECEARGKVFMSVSEARREEAAYPRKPEVSAVNVAFSAVCALRAAIWDEFFEVDDGLELGINDDDLDVDQWDSSFVAATVYAGGAIWVERSNDDKRRAFWEWWLREAVPQSYQISS